MEPVDFLEETIRHERTLTLFEQPVAQVLKGSDDFPNLLNSRIFNAHFSLPQLRGDDKSAKAGGPLPENNTARAPEMPLLQSGARSEPDGVSSMACTVMSL